MQALQLRQAQEQYRQTRLRLKSDLQETESALLRGVMPSALALQPPLRAAPISAPALGNGQVRRAPLEPCLCRMRCLCRLA